MVKRPIYVPLIAQYPYVKDILVEFQWSPGFALSQAQKSINSLHNEAKRKGIFPVLEISSKSTSMIGVSLSAFNLMLTWNGKRLSVESAFQGSKVFSTGGPYTELYNASSHDAKRDPKLHSSGELIGFNFFGEDFPTKPLTFFYDWLYLLALSQNPELSKGISNYQAFSDIAFNPQKSFNCQARSAALFVGLASSPDIDLERLLTDRAYHVDVLGGKPSLGQSRNEEPNQLGFLF